MLFLVIFLFLLSQRIHSDKSFASHYKTENIPPMLGTCAVPRYWSSLRICVRFTLEAKQINALLRDNVCQCVCTSVSSLKLFERISIKFSICALKLMSVDKRNFGSLLF